MSVPSPQHQLSSAENERIFRDDIVPHVLSGAQSQRRPVVVFIGGQTGAGKTAVTQMVTAALERQGGYINANMDFYTPHHPHYSDLLDQDETTASAQVRPDTEQWWIKAQHYAISQRHNVVIETALRSPAEFEDLIPAFRAGGYTVEVALLAVPQALSRLGVLSRYWQEVTASDQGKGRLVDPTVHDECYAGVSRAATALDERDLADTVFVFRRDGHAVYGTQRDHAGDRLHPATCRGAVAAERMRRWDAGERQWFRTHLDDLWRRIDPAWHPEIHRIRALAQPLLVPPPPALTAATHRLADRSGPGLARPGPDPQRLRPPGPPASPDPGHHRGR